jgi:hypothetical protein
MWFASMDNYIDAIHDKEMKKKNLGSMVQDFFLYNVHDFFVFELKNKKSA